MAINRHLLARLSRVFNAGVDLRDEGDQRINEWLKEKLAEAHIEPGCPDHTPAYGQCPDCLDILHARAEASR